jgi:hypothetical protein
VLAEIHGGQETVGQPLRARAFVAGQRDVWLVPVLSGGAIVRVLSIPVDPDGTLHGAAVSGWTGPFPHRLSLVDAAARASSGDDPAVTADLEWAVIDPREGGPASELAPFYLVTLRSGKQFIVFGSGNVVLATSVHPSP